MEQGLRQGRVLAPLLFNIFFATVISVAYTRLKADKDIIDAGTPEEGKGGEGKQLSESQSWRRHFWACFALTKPGSSHNPPSS